MIADQPFELGCLGCCIAYLCNNRHYLHYTQQQQNDDLVIYDRSGLPDNINYQQQPAKDAPVPQIPVAVKSDIRCRIVVCRKRGQLVTSADPNLGTVVYHVSPGDGRTYCVYGPRLPPQQQGSDVGKKKAKTPSKKSSSGSATGDLSLGEPTFPFEAVVRLESVLVGVATPGDLRSVRLSPAGATLVELYRAQRKLGSLCGVCVTKSGQQKPLPAAVPPQ
jgi:hypothetical protein